MNGSLTPDRLLIMLGLGLMLSSGFKSHRTYQEDPVPYPISGQSEDQTGETPVQQTPRRGPDFDQVLEPIVRFNRRIQDVSGTLEEIASSFQNLARAVSKLGKGNS